MTSQPQQSIPIAPDEVPEVQRFLEQMRAQKAMEAPQETQVIGRIVEAIRQLRIAGKAIDPVDPCWDSFPNVFK
jgi:hypothetical protein